MKPPAAFGRNNDNLNGASSNIQEALETEENTPIPTSNKKLKSILPKRHKVSKDYIIYSQAFYYVVKIIDIAANTALFFSKKPSPTQTPRRILISNCGDYGDAVLALPGIMAVKRAFPEAFIGFLGSAASSLVIKDAKTVDITHVTKYRITSLIKETRLINLPSAMIKLLTHRIQLVQEIRKQKYDVSIDFYPFPFSCSPIFHLGGIPARVGFMSSGLSAFLTQKVRIHDQPQPYIDMPRALLQAAWPAKFEDLPKLEPDYPHPKRQDFDQLSPTKPYLIVHMGTGAAYKEWAEENWIELIQRLTAADVTIVLSGAGQRETARINRVEHALASGKIQLFINKSWNDFVTLVREAKHVICLDSAICHVAAAFNVQTTAIFTGIYDLREWAPPPERCTIVMAPVACAPCNRRDCPEMACIRDVTPDEVADSVLRRIS